MTEEKLDQANKLLDEIRYIKMQLEYLDKYNIDNMMYVRFAMKTNCSYSVGCDYLYEVEFSKKCFLAAKEMYQEKLNEKTKQFEEL